jgi:Tfp pilus assembly protein PilX
MLTRLRRGLSARLGRDERGFAMLPVIAALTVSSLLVVGAVSAATGDLPISRESQDRKAAYGAAEAGLNYYLFHLNEDPDYWTKCAGVPDPNPGDPADNSPVNLAGASPRTWRTVPGTTSRYTIELLPAPGQANCVAGAGAEGSMLDASTGTFRIRSTGRSGNVTRSIIATFRRKGFLDFLYLTNFETLDPDADSSATTTVASCSKPRSLRPSGCTRIVFQDGDQLKGPLHTNDETILTCGVPIFGRTGETDRVEVTGSTAPGYINSGCTSGTPVFRTSNGALGLSAKTVDFPTSNSSLQTIAATPKGKLYTGKTIITLNGSAHTMNVWNANQSPQQQNNVPLPANGVIYVQAGTGCTLSSFPTAATYNEGNQCAVAQVSGTYDDSLTIGSAGDIIVKPTIGVNNTGLVRVASSPAVLGLIANRYVRVYHLTSDPVQDVQIDAAILSLQHSFIVDNFSSGAHVGYLRINGAIAQNFRGPVGQGSAGFTKDYNYDSRLSYRSPPYFLPPLNAAWSVSRKNEQVPAAAGA